MPFLYLNLPRVYSCWTVLTTHKQFDEKMVQKTLVNSGCNMIINSTPEYQMAMDEETNVIENKLPDTEKFDDFEEVDAIEVVDTETGEIHMAETNDEEDF